MTDEPRLYGVLVTYRRPVQLAAALSAIRQQTHPLHELVVVDNDGSASEVVARVAPDATYVRAPDNLGPAGGIALGMQRVLETARPTDWMFTFDDDDWAWEPDLFADLLAYALRMSAADPSTAAVGRSGTRFDGVRGRSVRVADAELHGPVPVDAIAGNQFPLYSVAAIAATGVFRADLFYGFEELEYGLRLRARGHHLYVDGDQWREIRARSRRLGLVTQPALGLHAPPQWERYYSIRNLIVVLRTNGAAGGAVRVTATTAIAKPLANLLRVPRFALQHLRVGLRASLDGWSDRLGRTLEPGSG
jgi:glycosyltransferase involved in cell wall biosynthesis